MNFCENCYFVSEQSRCPLCGSKRIRQVQDDDFCLLTENYTAMCEVLQDIFEDNDIPCSVMPYGSGIESHHAMPSSFSRLYVQYKWFEAAKTIIREKENRETESLRNHLLENVNQFNVEAKTEKKIRKKAKLSATQDFFDYCLSVVKSSHKIADKGLVSGCLKGGHYLYCHYEDTVLIFNSQTFEILSLIR